MAMEAGHARETTPRGMKAATLGEPVAERNLAEAVSAGGTLAWAVCRVLANAAEMTLLTPNRPAPERIPGRRR